MESSETCLRLFLLAAQVADEAGMEELAYEFYVQAFVIYEESISESRAQLQAITIIIRTLQGARVFGPENYDTLITKAALHGNRLLKKPQQATAVLYASHLWWQNELPERDGRKDNVSLLVDSLILQRLTVFLCSLLLLGAFPGSETGAGVFAEVD